MADFSNSFLRAADTDQIMATGESLEDSFFDYVTHGTVSAITSAAISFYNTGVALGDAIGFDVDDYYADTGEAINSVFGQQTADFYRRNKAGVDLAGFIAGSFIPGGVAISALRAAQRAGKLTNSMKLATGMKDADLVLGSPAMKRAKEAVLSRTEVNLNNPAVWRAYGRGLGQQVMEAAVAETAVVLTMNQSPLVNSEGYGYFEAAGSQFISGLPYVLGGGVLGGGIEAFRIRGALKRTWDSEMHRVADLANPELPEVYGMTAGDRISLFSRTLEDFRTNPLFAVEKGDDFAARQKAVGEGIINKAIEDALIEANGTGSSDIIPIFQSILKGDEAGKIDFEKLDSLMAGLEFARNFTLKEGEEAFAQAAKTRSPTFAGYVGDMNAGTGPTRGVREFGSFIFSQIGHRSGLMENQFVDAFEAKFRKAAEGSFGFARSGTDDVAPGQRVFNMWDADNGIIMQSAFTAMDTINGKGGLGFDFALEATNFAREKLDLPALSRTEYRDLVMLHELTHATANSPIHIAEFWKKFKDMSKGGEKGRKFMADAIQLSMLSRPRHWKVPTETAKKVADIDGISLSEAMYNVAVFNYNRTAISDKARGVIGEDLLEDAAYMFRPHELLADAGAQLAHPKTREAAAKLAPNIAKYFDKYGGVAKSFSPTKAYYNVRTGQTLTNYLPGINDYGKLVFGKGGLSSPTLKRAFTRSLKGFTRLLHNQVDDIFKVENDYLDFSAQWAIAQKADLADFMDEAGDITLDFEDLPMIERVLTDKEFSGNVFLKGKPASYLDDGSEGLPLYGKEDLQNHLVEMKLQMRGNLISNPKQAVFNEREIGHILNISDEAAMGFPASVDDMILMGSRDFGKPEVYTMNYTSRLPKEYKYQAHSAQAVQERVGTLRNEQQQAAASVMPENKLPSYDKVLASARANPLTGTESRAGFLTQARPDFGSLRELASYVGNIVRQLKNTVNQEVVEDFAKFFRSFNSVEAKEIRAELSFASNLMSRDWYYMARGIDKDGNQVRYMLKKDLANDPNFWGVESADDLPDIMDLTPEGLAIVDGARAQGAHGAVSLSQEVGDFLEMHRRRNAALVNKKQTIAKAKGKHFTGDPNVLYSPPRDLKKTKYFSFVIPTDFVEGADPRKFMVYGTTPEELALKTQKINEMYGGQYKVVTNQDAQSYKKLMAEYDSGLVFDEVHFDQGAFRTGTSAELAPNLDLEGSYTLERFRNFHHRQEEFVINSGVELKYAETLNQLKRVDAERSKYAKSTLFAKEQQSSIWEDTARMFFDDKGTGGELEQLWTRVNDFIGEKGSEILGNAIDTLLKGIKPGQRLTQDKLDEYNAYLADKGYNPPFQKVSEALIASPNLRDSRIVPSLVKTMNNLTSTMMLRLDAAHNMISVMSAPILLAPVLKEAKETLRGTPARQALDELTSTVHPSSGLREPSVMKLMANATKAFFTEDGKKFLQELRDRGMVADYLQEYVDATDFSMLNGRHTLQTVNHKIEQLARFSGKYTGFIFAEEFTRFATAHAIKQISDIRGIHGDEMFAIAQSAVDKVHGIYRNTQRAQLFQGPIGQAIGLYQTYMFNFAQNAAKWAMDPDRKKLALQAALQGSVFGIQSFPGFQTLNHSIGMANADNDFKDIYATLGATEEGSLGQYLLYGLGSHALITPIDFFGRGDMAIRNSLIVPTSFNEIPSVAIIDKAIGNMLNVSSQLAKGAPIGEALLHGLAHNGMNRPLQGLANIALGYTSNGRGQKYFDNINYLDYNGAEDLNWGGMFARLIGSKPFNESVYMQAYFRQKEYQASMNENLSKLSTTIQLSQSAGEGQNYYGWATEYEKMGGDPENFKAYFSRQLTRASESEMQEFTKELAGNTALGRLQGRLNAEYSEKPIWEY